MAVSIKHEVKDIVQFLEARRDAIGAERDKLRKIIDDYEELVGSVDAGLEHLQIAIDSLSEQA